MEILETTELVKFFAALIFVIALMGGLALIMKRLNYGRHALSAKKRRLKIVEILPVDSKRRLVLLERDSKQHLIMLGSNSETVIETGIESPQDGTEDHESKE